jgi:hypothetical protein
VEIKGLRLEGETTWDNIFQSWFEREGTKKGWQQVAKEKGWPSWEAWRGAWVSNFAAQERQWFRYTILNPLQTVPQFRVGPTQSWQNNFPETERNKHTFATLVERINYENNGKVRSILKNFPQPTEFIGIYLPDKSIVDIEGHHRATALAVAAKQKKKLVFTHLPTIVLTAFKEGEEQLLEIMLEKGSARKRLK